MKFGAREICDVVLKATVDGQKIGQYTYAKGQPVMYFDSLKTSSMEQASTPVYAQGGKGNSRLISWDGDKTMTYVMEDALLSPISLAILAKAGIAKPTANKPLIVHTQTRVKADTNKTLKIEGVHADENMAVWIGLASGDNEGDGEVTMYEGTVTYTAAAEEGEEEEYSTFTATGLTVEADKVYLVDFYAQKHGGDSALITIEPQSFEGNYYLEASTLFRDKSGRDLPAEFVIPNCKPQSAMTFAMASSGDPSTFTFTMDAFPGYTVYDPTKKVLAAIQIIDENVVDEDVEYNGLTQF